MVRFIMRVQKSYARLTFRFTFQYGQIYYRRISKKSFSRCIIYIPIWLDLLQLTKFLSSLMTTDLHSNMVRFIIKLSLYLLSLLRDLHSNMVRFIILQDERKTMKVPRFTFQYGQIYYKSLISSVVINDEIYIPIWLDLLYTYINIIEDILKKFTFQYGQIYYLKLVKEQREAGFYLHSNMVRFIIKNRSYNQLQLY